MKSLLLKVAAMIQSWSILCPPSHVEEFNSRLLDLTKLATTYENHVMISKNKCLYMNAINWRSNTLPHEAKALPSGSSFLEGTRLSGKWRDITKLGLSCEM